MTLTLNLPEDAERSLADKARAAGVDIQTYAECILRTAANRPPLDDVLRPVRDAFRESGLTDDELGDLLERAKHDVRTERRTGDQRAP
jgi:hypothetical protein